MKQLDHYETLKKMPHLNMDCIIYACNISNENLGLILRSADIFGVHTIIYNNSQEILNYKNIKKISRHSNTNIEIVNGIESIINLKKCGYEIVALEITDSSISIGSVEKFSNKICLIVGNERKGVPQELLDLVDYACHIEMIGDHISSLNVAVATSIALYEISQEFLHGKLSNFNIL